MNSVEDDSPSFVKHELGSSGPEATQHFVSWARIAFRPGQCGISISGRTCLAPGRL
jgi:hypothetical protein